jgi:NADH-quinone oxidoreductase subunit J
MVVPTDALVAVAFYLFAAIAVIGALGVVLARRVFHSALFLVVALAAVAAVFVVLGADFLGVVQVLVYVGAIMVLILFGIMLTPQNVELPAMGGKGQVAAGAIIAGIVLAGSVAVAVGSRWPASTAAPIDVPTTELIGTGLLTTYVLPFEVASILLLIAMIGAIVSASSTGWCLAHSCSRSVCSAR